MNKKLQSEKYLKLIDDLNLENTNEIPEAFTEVIKLKKKLDSYSLIKLLLIKAEVSSIDGDFKQIPLFTSMSATILASITFGLTIFKEQLDVYDLKALLTPVIIFLLGTTLFMLLSLFRNQAIKSRKITHLINIIDIVIKEKQDIELLYQEALIEYNSFLENN